MAVINPDEISSILKENIRNYEAKAEVSNVGSVLEVGDGIARIYGLRNVMSNELVEFQDGKGTLGITLNLEENNVGVVILGEYTHIKEGMTVKTTQTKKDDSIKKTTQESIGTIAPKKIRVTVTLPENMFYALENECKKIGATKNGYIISMLSKKLDIE